MTTYKRGNDRVIIWSGNAAEFEPGEEVLVTEVYAYLYDILTENGMHTFTLSELSNLTGLKTNLLSSFMRGMRSYGVVERIDKGVWRLIPEEVSDGSDMEDD